MYRLILPALAISLSACSTPQDICLRSLEKEQQTISGLIATTEANIERGYAFETQGSNSAVGVTVCTGDGPFRFCYGGGSNSPSREPVAIDPDAEARKLATLKTRYDQLRATQCRGDGVRISGPAG